MTRAGFRKDEGARGFTHVDKILKFQGASWYEPSGAVILYDDFIGQVMNPDIWDTVAVQATSGTVFATGLTSGGAQAGVGGWIAAATGTGDDDCQMVVGSLNFQPIALALGNGTLVYETRLCLPVITTVSVSAGFTDAVTESAAGDLFNVSVSDVVTAIPTDGVAWNFDTDQTTDVFRGIGVANGTTTTFGATIAGTAPPTDDPFTLRVEVDSSQVAYYSMSNVPSGYTAGDGVGPLVYYGSTAASGRSTIPLAPFVSVTARAGTDNLACEVDYIFVAQGRSRA